MMSNYSLPLFMQVKENAVQDLNKNLSLYMPKLIHTKTLILTMFAMKFVKSLS